RFSNDAIRAYTRANSALNMGIHGGFMKATLWQLILVAGVFASPALVSAQPHEQEPDSPVEKWSRKTVVLIGAHADDDMLAHGTLAMLQSHANQIYVITLTTGNVGTQDPDLSRTQLAQIRDRKSTRLNSSHVAISYAVFCL